MPKTLVVTTPLLALFLLACASQQRPIDGNSERQAVLHVIQGNELKDSMQRLRSLMLERNLTEPELDAQRRRVISLVQDVAKGAESSLNCILAAEQRLNLAEHQLTQFHALGDQLRLEVNTLRTQTETHQIAAISLTLENMNHTCTDCHVLFHPR